MNSSHFTEMKGGLFFIILSLSCIFIILPSQAELSDENLEQVFKLKSELLKLYRQSQSQTRQSKSKAEWLQNIPDAFLFNWVDYSNNNIQKSAQLLKNSLEWRDKNGIDKLQDWIPPEILKRELGYNVTGYLPNGVPVVYLPIGDWDVRQAIREGYAYEAVKNTIRIIDKSLIKANLRLNETERSKGGIGKIAVISEWNNWSLSQISSIRVLSLVGSVSRLFDTHFPLIGYKVYIINAPPYFSPMLDIMKRFLTSKTMDAFKVYGKDEAEWKSDLYQDFPMDLIPQELGGKSKSEILI